MNSAPFAPTISKLRPDWNDSESHLLGPDYEPAQDESEGGGLYYYHGWYIRVKLLHQEIWQYMVAESHWRTLEQLGVDIPSHQLVTGNRFDHTDRWLYLLVKEVQGTPLPSINSLTPPDLDEGILICALSANGSCIKYYEEALKLHPDFMLCDLDARQFVVDNYGQLWLVDLDPMVTEYTEDGARRAIREIGLDTEKFIKKRERYFA